MLPRTRMKQSQIPRDNSSVGEAARPGLNDGQYKATTDFTDVSNISSTPDSEVDDNGVTLDISLTDNPEWIDLRVKPMEDRPFTLNGLEELCEELYALDPQNFALLPQIVEDFVEAKKEFLEIAADQRNDFNICVAFDKKNKEYFKNKFNFDKSTIELAILYQRKFKIPGYKKFIQSYNALCTSEVYKTADKKAQMEMLKELKQTVNRDCRSLARDCFQHQGLQRAACYLDLAHLFQAEDCESRLQQFHEAWPQIRNRLQPTEAALDTSEDSTGLEVSEQLSDLQPVNPITGLSNQGCTPKKGEQELTMQDFIQGENFASGWCSIVSSKIAFLVDNIKRGANGRLTSGKTSEKVKLLENVQRLLNQIKDMQSPVIFEQGAKETILGMIKAICNQKRHHLNFFATPHSVKEFAESFARISTIPAEVELDGAKVILNQEQINLDTFMEYVQKLKVPTEPMDNRDSFERVYTSVV